MRTVQGLLADPTTAGTWTLKPKWSSTRFVARTLWGLVPVRGCFPELAGEGAITREGALSGRLVIRASSVRTGIGMRDRHLRSADFFDVETFPEIAVDIAIASPKDAIVATMTIRGTTLPIQLTGRVVRLGEDSVEINAQSTVDRTQWGVSGNLLGMMPSKTLLEAEAVFTRVRAEA